MQTSSSIKNRIEVREPLQQAAELIASGKLAAAKRICLKQLKRTPNDPELLHQLGLIELRNGAHEQAAKSLAKAVAGNLGNAVWLAELSQAHLGAGHRSAALDSIDEALEHAPAAPAFLLHRSDILQSLGRFYEALAACSRLLKIDPAHTEALLRKGVLLDRFEKFEEAVECYRAVIEQEPNNKMAWSRLCNDLCNLGRPEEALAEYERLLELMPDNASEWYNRGNTLNQLGRYEEAVESYANAVTLLADYADAWYNRGNALYALKRFNEAQECFKQTLEINPAYTLAWLNRGNALLELFRPKEALACFERAIELKPDLAEAWMNRSNACGDLHWLPQAVQSCARALELRPGFAEAGFNLALATLRQGNFRDGWRLYEWRWQQPKWLSWKRNFSQPLWLGNAPLEGKTIVLHAEQGLGDTIQFSRHVSQVAKLGANVVMQVQAPLVPLFSKFEGVSEALSMEEELPPFDLHCPIASLPLAFGVGDATPISGAPYLKVDGRKKGVWKRRLGAKSKPRIGIVWSGNTEFPGDHKRSLSAAQLLPFLPEGFEYICLQKELREQDKEMVEQSGIQFYGDKLRDFADTAALCSQMDLVLTTCTSVAHLSGALGMPTWVLLQFTPDFRWLLDRSDSPWYDSITLFRQPRLGDWQGVLQQLHDELLRYEAIEPS